MGNFFSSSSPQSLRVAATAAPPAKQQKSPRSTNPTAAKSTSRDLAWTSDSATTDVTLAGKSDGKHSVATIGRSGLALRKNRGQGKVSGKSLKLMRNYVQPSDLIKYSFTADGKVLCWRFGQQTAENFCAQLGDQVLDYVPFNAKVDSARTGRDSVVIFFPYLNGDAVTRTVKIKTPLTLRKLLDEIDTTALMVAARVLCEPAINKTVTEVEADRQLKHTSMCSMSIKKAGGSRKVWVNLDVDTRSSMYSSGNHPTR